MAYRRRQLSLPGHSDGGAPNNMDQLAFNYMEMCKVESSTDSDSEISPRWSDTSTMGCASSAPESRPFRRTLPLTHKPAGRHGCHSLFLDPYDGSSEDSDQSHVDAGVCSRRTRQQGKGGCRFSGRSRRFVLHHPASVTLRDVVRNGMREPALEQQHLLDDPMKCGSDSELWLCELDLLPTPCGMNNLRDPIEDMSNDATVHIQSMDLELNCQFDDSGLHATRSTTPETPGPVTLLERSSSLAPESSNERSPSPFNHTSLHKRKLGVPGAEVLESGQRKRQCVINMEDEVEGGDSASEPCES